MSAREYQYQRDRSLPYGVEMFTINIGWTTTKKTKKNEAPGMWAHFRTVTVFTTGIEDALRLVHEQYDDEAPGFRVDSVNRRDPQKHDIIVDRRIGMRLDVS